MAVQPKVKPVKKEQAPAEVKQLLEDIQDTMGTPWPAANWRSYAMYPQVMRLFWERLKPAVATASFLDDALEITRRAYRNAGEWYRPAYDVQVPEEEQERIRWELDAFEFGNAQLLIQQAALSAAMRGEVVGRETPAEPRPRSNYREPEIMMIPEEEASGEVKSLYQDIKETLDLPVVNSDYQALAKWPGYFAPAWEDAKPWRERSEYRQLREALVQMGEEAAGQLAKPVRIEEDAMRQALGDPGELENLRRMVGMFSYLMPGLIVNDALFRIGVAICIPAAPPEPTRLKPAVC